jgi:hypothetical protein
LSFPYICPEPVLVNDHVSYKMAQEDIQYAFFAPQSAAAPSENLSAPASPVAPFESRACRYAGVCTAAAGATVVAAPSAGGGVVLLVLVLLVLLLLPTIIVTSAAMALASRDRLLPSAEPRSSLA